MYVAYNPSAKLFVSQDCKMHYTATPLRENAKLFGSKAKAQNILAMVGYMIEGEWFVLDDTEPLPAAKQQPESFTSARNECILQRINELQTLCQGRRKQAQDMVSNADKELCDAYHYIEFSNCNAAEGYQAYRMMKDILLRRREAKDECATLEALSSLIETSVKTAARKIPQRTYHPRVRNELFEKK